MKKRKIISLFLFLIFCSYLQAGTSEKQDILDNSSFFTKRNLFRKKNIQSPIISEVSLGLDKRTIQSKILLRPHVFNSFAVPFFSLVSKVNKTRISSSIDFSLGLRFKPFQKGIFSLYQDWGFNLENEYFMDVETNKVFLFLSPKLYVKVVSGFYLVSTFDLKYNLHNTKDQSFWDAVIDEKKLEYSFIYSFVSML